MNAFTGLIQESPQALEAMMAGAGSLEGVYCAPETETRLPAVPDWMQRDNQSSLNSCVGHGLTSALEKVVYMKTGVPTQLSRLFAYKVAQKATGIRGDNGAQLSGATKAAKTYGICREEVFPYGPYSKQLTEEAYADAKNWVVTQHMRVPNYSAWRTALGGNICGIMTASKWPIEISKGYASHYRPRGNGGHCYSALFLADTADAQGRPDVWMFNSHSGNFTFKASATFVEELLGRNPNESVGFTDLTVIAPRPVDWLKDSPEYL